MKQKQNKRNKTKSNPGSTTKGSRAHRIKNKHGIGKTIKRPTKKRISK